MYRILIVDDERIEREGIKMLLKRLDLDIEMTEASNGKQAYEMLMSDYKIGKKTDILLTDVKMPFMDGIELIKSVTDAGMVMKTIIFSGYNEFEYAKLAVKLGVSDYILKPVDPGEFGDTIRKIIKSLDEIKNSMLEQNEKDGYMKDYLLYSLINTDNPQKVCAQAERLKVGKFWNYYSYIMLIEFNTDVFGVIINDFRDEIMNDTGFSEDKYDYLNLNQQQAVVLVNDNALKLANKINRIIYEKTGKICYIAVSDKFSDYSEIPGIMNELDSLMENKFYQTDNYIYSAGVSDEVPVLVQIDDDTLMKQMKQDIKMKDVESLKEHFDRLCGKYRKKTSFSHIYIKFIFSNLLKDFYENIPEMKEKEFNEQLDKMYQSVDFSCIMDIINKHIDMLEKSFESNPQTKHREIEAVKKYIYGHYQEEIGVDQLADMVYLTPSYLSVIFKRETGQNLSKFIKQVRMEKAREMLETTNKKIVTVGNETGYSNVSYFCQSFREYYGVSPQKFRDGLDCGSQE